MSSLSPCRLTPSRGLGLPCTTPEECGTYNHPKACVPVTFSESSLPGQVGKSRCLESQVNLQ